jgi:hypothetical protein
MRVIRSACWESPRCGKLAARMETSPGEVDVERLGRMMTQAEEEAG